MAKVVTCPSCHARGAIPDDAPAARIRCPKCGTVYKLGAEVPSAPPPIGAAPGATRSPAPPQANHRVLLLALLGVSGVVVALLGVIVVLLIGGGRDASAPRSVAAAPEPAVAPAVPPSALSPPAAAAPVDVTPTNLAVRAFGAGKADPAPVVVDAPRPSIPDRAPPPDPQAILRHLKDATVLINTKVGNKTIGNGSGFVIEVDHGRVIVATNRHVAVTDPGELPEALVARGIRPTLEAVFRSGSGRDEQSLPAQIIAADLSGELSTDLAFLVIQGVRNPPKPIDPFQTFEPIEGMSYLGAGFPLAGVIKVAENEGKPSVVVTGGRISSFKRDEFGNVLVLQVDGSLQPGNSGGPIIDERTGRLLGLAVAKASIADTIGFVVPAEQVRRALGGRVGGLAVTLEKSTPGKADLTVKANLVDPKMQVAGVVVRAAPLATVGKLVPNSDGSWPALPHSQPVELERSPRTPSATGHVQVALAGAGANGRKVLIQAAHRDLRGRLIYGRPREVFLPDHPGPIRDAGSMKRLGGKVLSKSLAMLGPLVDPSKDCLLYKDERSYRVRIDIPGKLHTISPAFVMHRNTPVHNAPMTLAEVQGDFLAQATIAGPIDPGPKLPPDRASHNSPFTFQSAGLVLYQDKQNFLRLERAASIIIDRLTPVHRLLVEVVRDGRQAIDPIYLDIPEGDTKLLLMRSKGRIRCLFVAAGSGSLGTFHEFALDWPDKIKVGLVASNISAQPFTATFQNFALLSDATQIDGQTEDE